MRTEPQFQGQHKVSQVYLKQFGYKKDNEWWLSVYEAGQKHTEVVKISNFTKETNIFDLPVPDQTLGRYFENYNNKIENYYPTVISNLRNQKRLTKKDAACLNSFVANMMCRTNPCRSFFDDLLRHSDTRDKFINEMTMFSEDTADVRNLLNMIKIDFQLNIALIILMTHLNCLFRRFNKVILRGDNHHGWTTTDSPVHIDKQGRHEWIIPLESEIYLPLSKEFCLFMFHAGSEIKTNPLRNLVFNRINEIDNKTFDMLTKKICCDYDRYWIMNIELDPQRIVD
jgi:hypothetical protein